ncbi:MAG: hypothetical protein PHH93_10290 [Prolixibacteraceae bacterium]|nr:hypothetical protein [Prolixibacteraceae bacterium]
MKITRDNYELYFLDYLDHNLDEHLINDLFEFLRENPDLEDELEIITTHTLEPENILFRGKSKLYKDKYDQESVFNNAAIARLEGDETGEDKTGFEKYLANHPEKQKDIVLFENTKLKHDISVTCRIKHKLYRTSNIKSLTITILRIAAVLLPAILIFRFAEFMHNQKNSNEIQITATITGDDKKVESPQSVLSPATLETKGDLTASYRKQGIRTYPQQMKEKQVTEQNSNQEELPEREKITMHRMTAKDPERLAVHTASATINPIINNTLNIPETTSEIKGDRREERLIADVVKEKTGIDEISINKIAKAGLTLMSRLSDKKLLYETDKSGNITEISYESRLLAFTIPTSN